MLFMSVATWKSENRDEILKRRAEKGSMVPDGVKAIGEWIGGPYVIRVFETDDQNDILMGTLSWNDIFDVTVYPAFDVEEMMKVLSP
jgi:Domain of unknown function (DUF3303)